MKLPARNPCPAFLMLQCHKLLRIVEIKVGNRALWKLDVLLPILLVAAFLQHCFHVRQCCVSWIASPLLPHHPELFFQAPQPKESDVTMCVLGQPQEMRFLFLELLAAHLAEWNGTRVSAVL